ncbi:Kinetochore protein NDC80-like protein [Bienertia sinuspersici]
MEPLMFLLFKISFEVPNSLYSVLFFFLIFLLLNSSFFFCFQWHQALSQGHVAMVSHTCSASTKTFPSLNSESSRPNQRKVFLWMLSLAWIQNEELENDVKKLKETNWTLEDEVVEMAIENTEQLAIITSTTTDKKLYNLLVASWVLFAIVLLLLGRGG